MIYKQMNNINITISNSNIEQVLLISWESWYFRTSWNPHVDNVSIKISRVTDKLRKLRKLQHFLPKHILITIDNSFIHFHLAYDLFVWGLQSVRVVIQLALVHIYPIPHLYLRN